ncbi:hypothetical protein Agub_g13556, partial [Astrephomene gubernaculifera]
LTEHNTHSSISIARDAMPLVDLVKEIQAKKLKAVQERLKREKASQKYVPDAKKPGIFHSLLHVAVKAGDPAIVEALLAAAADVNAVDNEDSTALHWAARGDGAPKIAELLLKKKTKVDAVNKAGLTPLHVAVAAGAMEVVNLLLKAGAPADICPATSTTAAGSTPLQVAVRRCCEGALSGEQLAQLAARLAAAGAKMGGKDNEGHTPLSRLLSGGRVAEALALLAALPAEAEVDCGANEKDPSGRTPLLVAVAALGAGAAGAAGAAAAGDGASAPSEVTLQQQQEQRRQLVRALVARGASADAQDPASGDTPLHLAARRADLDLVSELLPASKLPYTRNNAGATAAEVALLPTGTSSSSPSGGASAAVAEAVVEAGGDPGEAGVRLMKVAMERKVDGLASKLLPHLSPAALSSLALDLKGLMAAGLGKTAAAYLLRQQPQQAAGGALDGAGGTLLHRLAEEGAQYEALLALLSRCPGLSPNAANAEGDTPLHVAARAGHVEVCRALVAGGADVLKRNNKNRTPRSQLKLPEATREYLGEAEEAAKAAKEAKKSELWDDKMKATQTESAFGLRVM